MHPMLLALSVSASAHSPARTPEEALDRAEAALDAVDATDDQRSTVRVILEDTLPTLFAFHEEAHEIHERIHALFMEPKIDRDVLEVRGWHLPLRGAPDPSAVEEQRILVVEDLRVQPVALEQPGRDAQPDTRIAPYLRLDSKPGEQHARENRNSDRRDEHPPGSRVG